ncbi:MAG TPA: hypothetical protein VHF89_10755 [Solirubrobacteraceae bacterium]|nr:hypothetical protein [Solirubrobacteraceae bacterium]
MRALGAALLGGQAAVHLQQFAATFHGVRWIGPLFVADAAACVAAGAALGLRRRWSAAAFAGAAVSVLALGALAVSYGDGLLGWQEEGLRTPIAVAVACEVGAVLTLAAALAVAVRNPKGDR